MSKKAPAEIYVFKELAFDPRHPHRRPVNPQRTLHGVVDGHLARGRIVLRIRYELHAHHSIFAAVISKAEGVRNIFQKLAGLVRIRFFPFSTPRAVFGHFHLPAPTTLLMLALFDRERLAVEE